ncbi:cytochrome c [Flavobacterium sp.]|uniref:cytochrome c n=1 Tax=Flavobacterium sp. TaxID=239 RepID=UPI0026192FFA|nr:cytochrome c [Flavobacterium sp.]
MMKTKIWLSALGLALLYACSSTPKPTVAPEVTVVKKELTPELAEGKNLYEGSCGQCHQLYKPNSYNAEAWKPIVARMQKKAHLSDEQGMKIYNYLTSGAE